MQHLTQPEDAHKGATDESAASDASLLELTIEANRNKPEPLLIKFPNDPLADSELFNEENTIPIIENNTVHPL